jgi:hypothetical protein
MKRGKTEHFDNGVDSVVQDAVVHIAQMEESHSASRAEHRKARELLSLPASARQIEKKSIMNGQEGRGLPAGRRAGGTLRLTNGNGGSMHKTTKPLAFRSLSGYENSELRAVKFSNDHEAHRALVLIRNSPQLKDMPFQFADGLTFIIPAEALDLLHRLRLRFTVSTVLSMDDLDPEERAEIRRCQSL